MRLRVAAACGLVAMAVGVGATGAVAAKPPLWLVEEPGTSLRASEGSGVEVAFDAEGTCETFQRATLATNGKPRDELGGIESPFFTGECRSGLKIAGTITAVAMTPAASGTLTMSAKDTLHVFVEPWCVYTVPKKLNFTAKISTSGTATFTSALDKAASFGTCAAKRPIEVALSVVLNSDNEVLFSEPTG